MGTGCMGLVRFRRLS
ncbi:hypothetical protein [Spirosoma foliorum]